MIALVMFLLLINGKNFGMSSNLRTLCTMCGADKNCQFFCFDWKKQRWNLMVVVGTIAGGFIAAYLMTKDAAVNIHPDVIGTLSEMGFKDAGEAYLPDKLFALEALTDIKSLVLLAIGGFFVGFGARYAGGCTSGHAISGLSDLQLASLIAVIGFFVGGLFMIHFLYPIIF
jgi:hypothetical protein